VKEFVYVERFSSASGAHLLEEVVETRIFMQVFAPVGLLERLARLKN
jgi:hypothetical protein